MWTDLSRDRAKWTDSIRVLWIFYYQNEQHRRSVSSPITQARRQDQIRYGSKCKFCKQCVREEYFAPECLDSSMESYAWQYVQTSTFGFTNILTSRLKYVLYIKTLRNINSRKLPILNSHIWTWKHRMLWIALLLAGTWLKVRFMRWPKPLWWRSTLV